jgi:hypothetical protein
VSLNWLNDLGLVMSMVISGSADQAIQREMESDERLLCSGMPRQGWLLRSNDIFLIPFSLMWGSFAFFWEFSVISMGKAPFFFVLWGIPFVLVGIYIIIGRFFVDSYQRRRTYYGLTDRRALILSGLTAREVKTLSLQNLNEMSLKEKSDGSGNIFFGSLPPMYSMYGTAWPSMSKKLVPAFEMIDNVRNVYDLIKGAQRSKV